MNFKRLVGAENGWGAAIGMLLLLGFGLSVLFISVAGMAEASRLKPEEKGCAAWLADSSGARWVKLVGCQLDVSAAQSSGDGGVLVPLFVGDSTRGILATSDQGLLALMDGGVSHTVSGYVEPAKDSDRVVLTQGKQPPRLKVVFGLVAGLIAVALVVRSMFMRYLVDRDSSL